MTNNEEFLVPVSIAKKLKEIGFDSPCLFIYRNGEIFLEGIASVGFSLDPNNTDFVATLDQLEGTTNQEGTDWVTIPTYEQVFAWFRERGIHGEIVKIPKVNGWVYSVINDNDDNKRVGGKGNVYEDVRLECLIKCLEELISFYGEES